MNLAGVFAPVPTPFDDRDRVDTARLRAALTKWMTRPLNGVVVLGSNAEAVLVRTPGFFKTQMTNDAFVRHYTAVADASPVPVLLYNFTALTGVNLLPAAVARLALHPNIIGMKESGGDVAQIDDLVSVTADDLNVLAGTTATFYAALCVVAVGGIL